MATPTNLPASFVSGDILTAANMNSIRGSFRVLQIKQTNLLTAQSFSTTYADITGLSVSITPQFTSSQILVVVTATLSGAANATVFLKCLRGSTDIGVSTAGSSINGNVVIQSAGIFGLYSASFSVLDSPASISALTYKVQGVTDTGTGYVNRRNNDANFGGTSSITVYEISA